MAMEEALPIVALVKTLKVLLSAAENLSSVLRVGKNRVVSTPKKKTMETVRVILLLLVLTMGVAVVTVELL